MIFLQVILIVDILGPVSGQCEKNSWPKFNRYGYDDQVLSYNRYFIRALESTKTEYSQTTLTFLSGDISCRVARRWDVLERVVEYTDWTGQFYLDDQWGYCPRGYFLAGLGILEFLHFLATDFSYVVSGRCIRPAGHPRDYGQCYVEEASHCFAVNDSCSCKEDHFITGLHKSQGVHITALDKLKCCTMAQRPQAVKTFEDLKTRVMETLLEHVALLANSLGFSYCWGARGVYSGEDFIRAGDTWKASSKMFDTNRKCSELKCNERLTIQYGDWGLEAADIKYGESVIDDVQTEIIVFGEIKNNASAPLTASLTASKYVTETVTNTVGQLFSTGPELVTDFNFDIPLPSGSRLKHTFKVQLNDTDVTQTAIISNRSLGRKFSMVLERNSEASYNITVRKTRTIIPYTAVVAVKFSTEFRGYLSWQPNRYRLAAKNYHHLYRNTYLPVYFTYRFGNKSVPFYRALKMESENYSPPWVWKQMFDDFCITQQSIDRFLTKEFYEFKNLNGTLEIFSDPKFEVFGLGAPLDVRDSGLR